MKIKERHIVFLVLTLATMLVSFIDKDNYTIFNILNLLIYIELPYKPIIALLVLLIKNLLYIIFEPSSFGDSVGVNLILILLALLINTKLIKLNDKSIKDRALSFINHTRGLIKIKPWLRIVLYSTIVTLVATLAKTAEIQAISNETHIQIFTSLVVLVPTIEFLAILTTSTLYKDIMILEIMLKTYTFLELLMLNSFSIVDLVKTIIILIAVLYGLFRRIYEE